MDRLRPDFCRLAAIALLGLGLALGGCGDDESGPESPDPGSSGDWSEPVAPDPGSPDGDAVQSAAQVLERLRMRIAGGEGNSGPSYQQDVEAVAAVLWGDAADPRAGAAAQVHTEVSNVSGEVARWLAADENARVERTKSHPHDVGLHDAQLAALSRGPDAYAAWCGGEGARLLSAMKEARYREMFGGR